MESHHTRALLTSRKVIRRKCVDLENEIRGLLPRRARCRSRPSPTGTAA
jgi:hypothetical protein